MPYYGVAKGRTPGIFMNWSDCKAQVDGYSGATFKKFGSVEGARDFVVNPDGGASASSNGNHNCNQPSSAQCQQPSAGGSGGHQPR